MAAAAPEHQRQVGQSVPGSPETEEKNQTKRRAQLGAADGPRNTSRVGKEEPTV